MGEYKRISLMQAIDSNVTGILLLLPHQTDYDEDVNEAYVDMVVSMTALHPHVNIATYRYQPLPVDERIDKEVSRLSECYDLTLSCVDEGWVVVGIPRDRLEELTNAMVDLKLGIEEVDDIS